MTPLGDSLCDGGTRLPDGERVTINVVLATFNRASLLERALDALRSQDFGPGDAVYVVNNGSTDLTEDVLRRAQRDFPVPLWHLRELEPGKTAALNTGVLSAPGDLIALIDDDVTVARDWILTIRQMFCDPALALVGGRVDPLWECDPPRWLRVEKEGQYSSLSAPLALLHYGDPQPLGARTAVGANMVVRRSVFEVLGVFSPALGRHRGTLLCGEDHEFCQRVAAAGYRSEYRPELRVRHWVPANRMRVSYFTRWFFWLGITHGMLEKGSLDSHASDAPRVSALARYALTASVSSVQHGCVGRLGAASEQLMEVAYTLGRLAEHVGYWRREAEYKPPAPLAQT